MLTMALTTCSASWLTAVGTMVSCPWKYPRNTPMMARIRSAGARIRRAKALSGVCSTLSVKNPAPKKVITEVAIPVTRANTMAPWNTLWALRYSPLAFLADTCLATASGML